MKQNIKIKKKSNPDFEQNILFLLFPLPFNDLQIYNFIHQKFYPFCDLNPLAKFQNTTIVPSRRKVTHEEREKEEKKTPLIVDT